MPCFPMCMFIQFNNAVACRWDVPECPTGHTKMINQITDRLTRLQAMSTITNWSSSTHQVFTQEHATNWVRRNWVLFCL